MFEYIEEPEIADFDNLSVFEFKSKQNSPKKPSSPSMPTDNDSMNRSPSPLSLKENPKDVKVNRKIAKGKKDDFDYKRYIDQELKRLKAENLEGKAKKRLVQKIRNRMSAQRSRQRNKVVLETLKQENEELRQRNNQLISNLRSFREENALLRERLGAVGSYKRSYSSTDNDEIKSYDSEQYIRQEKPNQLNRFGSFLFVAIMIVALAFGTESANGNIQMAGVVPLLSSQVLRSEKSVKRLEQICEAYYHRECGGGKETKHIEGMRDLARDSRINKSSVLSPTTKGHTGMVPMMCMEKGSSQNGYEILFDKESLDSAKADRHVLYVPKVLTIVNNFDLTQN